MKKHLNIQTLLLLAFTIRLLITGSSVGDAIAIVGLSALYGYSLLLESKKEPIANKELWDRVVAMEEVSKSTKETVHSLKLASGFRK